MVEWKDGVEKQKEKIYEGTDGRISPFILASRFRRFAISFFYQPGFGI
jgi:hypothetical protein